MPVNFKNIKTTQGREYDERRIQQLNDSLQYLPIKQRASVLASIIEESGGNPLAKSSTEKYQGLLQWGRDRYAINSDNPDEELASQVEYMRNTFNNTADRKSWTNGGKGSGYNSLNDVYGQFDDQSLPLSSILRGFSYGYVRPEGKEASYNNRLKVASQVYDRIDDYEKHKMGPAPADSTPFKEPSIKKALENMKARGGKLDFLKPETAWDSLSLPAKAEMMRVAVANGIFNLNDIKKRYNEFAEGGDTDGRWTMQDEAGYRQWREELPDNLKYTDDDIYDMRRAYKAGMQPTLEDDGLYHLGSRDPHTGRILKSPQHPTYLIGLLEDENMGYFPMYKNGVTYTRTWKGNEFADGGDKGNRNTEQLLDSLKNIDRDPLVQLANRYDGYTQPTQQMYVTKPDALYVKTSDIIEPVYPDMSESGALKRANRVYSNYDKAKDNPIIGFNLWQRNARRYLKDNVWDGIPAGISNCTLTATQWVDPTNFVKSAASIISDPEEHGYTQISENDAVPGNLIIAKVPGKKSYHTMMIEGFTDKEGSYKYNGKTYNYRKGEPLVRYSRGGHDDSFLRAGIPLSVYTANSDGHVENYFYRYNYPNSIFLDEITVTPEK